MLAILVDEWEKFKPVVKEVVVDLTPKVARSGRANVKPKRCSPDLFLRTQIDGNLSDIAHEVHQLA